LENIILLALALHGVTILEILVVSEILLSETWIQYKTRCYVPKIQKWQQKKIMYCSNLVSFY